MITCEFEDGGKAQFRHVTTSVYIFNKSRTKMLLIKRSPKYSEPLKWAPPGGYMNRDENLETSAVREVKEETGHDVNILALLRINDNPDRPKEDKQNIDFSYLAEAEEQEKHHDDEISEIKWFEIDNLPSEEEFAFDLYENVKLALKYIKEPFTIPIVGKI